MSSDGTVQAPGATVAREPFKVKGSSSCPILIAGGPAKASGRNSARRRRARSVVLRRQCRRSGYGERAFKSVRRNAPLTRNACKTAGSQRGCCPGSDENRDRNCGSEFGSDEEWWISMTSWAEMRSIVPGATAIMIVGQAATATDRVRPGLSSRPFSASIHARIALRKLAGPAISQHQRFDGCGSALAECHP
jgi:hypothetical protein